MRHTRFAEVLFFPAAMQLRSRLVLLGAVAIVAAAILAGVIAMVAGLLPNTAPERAYASHDTITAFTPGDDYGFDMLPFNGVGNGPAALGPIDSCASTLTEGAVFDFDVFYDGIPSSSPPTPADLAGVIHTISALPSYSLAGLTVTGYAETTAGVNILTSQGTTAIVSFSTVPPAPLAGFSTSVSDFGGTAETNPPTLRGTVARYTVDTTAVGPGLYPMVLGSIFVGNSLGNPIFDPGDQQSDAVDDDGDTLTDEDSIIDAYDGFGIIAVGVPCPLPADLAITDQSHTATPDGDVSVNELFEVQKVIHNLGPNPSVMVNVISTADPPVGCDVSYHFSGGEVINIVQDVPYRGDLGSGVGPATLGPGALNDVVIASGTPAVSGEMIVDFMVDPALDSVAYVVTETWDKHCFEPSFHELVITNTIEPADFGVIDPNPIDNTWVTVVSEAIWAYADVKVISTEIAGVDTNGDTTVDLPGPPSGSLGRIISDDDFDNDGDTLVDEDPIDGADNDADTLIDEDGGEVLRIVVRSTLHNNGPFGPVEVLTDNTGTGIVPTGGFAPAGTVPANCTLTFISGPATVNLPVSIPTDIEQTYDLHCGFSPFQDVNDDFPADLAVDEDPIDGAVNDDFYHPEYSEDGGAASLTCFDGIDNGGGDGADAADLDCQQAGIDEDPSFEIAAFDFVKCIYPNDPHVIDDNLPNNCNGASDQLPALLPSTPSGDIVIDSGAGPGTAGHTFPAVSGDPPLTGDCIVSAPCETLFIQTQPGGNPLHAFQSVVSNPDGVPGGLGFDIANGLLDLTGSPLLNGTVVADVNFALRIQPIASCNLPIFGNIALSDGALPGVGSSFAPNGGLIEGPDSMLAAALDDPAVWPRRLELDPFVSGLVISGGIVWARYVGFEPITALEVNVIVVNMGTGGYEHITVFGDPTTPSGLIVCTPFTTEVDLFGLGSGGELLRVCDEVGTHAFPIDFTNTQMGVPTSDGPNSNTCSLDIDGDGIGDAVDPCPTIPGPSGGWLVPLGDSDCDGFTDVAEGLIGTESTDACADTPAANDEVDDKWPPDFDDNRVINTTDVFQVLPPYLGTSVPPTSPRRDLAPSGVINTTDVFQVLPPFLGSSCTP